MDVTTFAAPAPGSARPGDLYVDLQSRQLWLGVDVSVDPSGSVLISDIVDTQADIAAALATATAYTDSKVALLAPKASPVFTGNPTAPTPATADNDTTIATTAFVKAAIAADPDVGGVTAGCMVEWAGPLTKIGVGVLAGWALCDGASLLRSAYPALFTAISTTWGSVDSTHFNIPDFRDRFSIGAGNKPVAAKNTPAGATTSVAGDHVHTVSGTALNASQIPSHTHSLSVSGTGTFTTDVEPAHTHGIAQGGDGGNGRVGRGDLPTLQTLQSGAAGSHDHKVTVTLTSTGTSGATGSGAAHTHTLSTSGSHTHGVTASDIRENVPYLAVPKIIKLV